MGEHLSRLVVQKECGLVFDMTPSVSVLKSLVVNSTDTPVAMRRVLLLKMVTQCAMLEEFGIFLVLADKVSQRRTTRRLHL